VTYTPTSVQQLLRRADRALHGQTALTAAALEALLVEVEGACQFQGFPYISATSDVTGKRIMLEDLRRDLWRRLEDAGRG